jgi:hypothetical protein
MPTGSFRRTPLPTMTNDPDWRTVVILCLVLSALFGALLGLVGLKQRGHRAAPARRATSLSTPGRNASLVTS